MNAPLHDRTNLFTILNFHQTSSVRWRLFMTGVRRFPVATPHMIAIDMIVIDGSDHFGPIISGHTVIDRFMSLNIKIG